MTLLICVGKWVVSGFAFPAAIALFLWFCSWAKVLEKRPKKAPRMRPPMPVLVRRVAESALVTVVFTMLLAVVSAVVFVSARVLLPAFGCDECLPRAWQEMCLASEVDRLERADRAWVQARAAEIRVRCDKWGWTECPVPPVGALPEGGAP